MSVVTQFIEAIGADVDIPIAIPIDMPAIDVILQQATVKLDVIE